MRFTPPPKFETIDEFVARCRGTGSRSRQVPQMVVDQNSFTSGSPNTTMCFSIDYKGSFTTGCNPTRVTLNRA